MTARRSKRPALKEAKRTSAGDAGVKRALDANKQANEADAARAAKEAAKAKREKMTFLFDPDLAAELRAASTEIPPKAFGATLSGMVERAVRSELEGLRRKWNSGKPFDTSEPVQTRKGRPPKK